MSCHLLEAVGSPSLRALLIRFEALYFVVFISIHIHLTGIFYFSHTFVLRFVRGRILRGIPIAMGLTL